MQSRWAIRRPLWRSRVPASSADGGGAACGVRQPRLPQVLILLFTSSLVTMVTAVIGPSLPAMQEHFRDVPGNEALVPLTMSAPLLMMALVSVLVGELADRWGRKRMLVGAALVYAVIGTMPMYLDSLAAILASRMALGAFEGVLITISTTMIGDYFVGVRRDRYMALQTTVASVSAIVLSFVGGLLATQGWRAPYAMFALSVLLAPLSAYFLWEPQSRATMTVERRLEDSQSFDASGLVWRCLLAFLLGCEFLVLGIHFGYLQAAVGVESTAMIGLAYALNSCGAVVGTLLFGWRLASTTSIAACLAIGALLAGGGMAVMPFATGYATLTAAGFVTGMGVGVLFPSMTTWNMRELPVSRRGVGIGAFSSCLSLGMFVSPLAVLGMERAIGGPRVQAVALSGHVLVLAGLAACVMALLWRRKR